nr:PREDICTED: THAP domain-containing protein 2-like [Linepithema humile]
MKCDVVTYVMISDDYIRIYIFKHLLLIWILYFAMPYICCASRCFNKSGEGYALVRFPKEDQYQKAWSDAVWGENASKRSLENLRLCEVHFEPSDFLVVGRRKEIKKDAIPSRFCRCPSDNSYNKSQARKRKKKETYVRNIKAKLDTSQNSNHQYSIEHSYSKRLSENRLP